MNQGTYVYVYGIGQTSSLQVAPPPGGPPGLQSSQVYSTSGGSIPDTVLIEWLENKVLENFNVCRLVQMSGADRLIFQGRLDSWDQMQIILRKLGFCFDGDDPWYRLGQPKEFIVEDGEQCIIQR